MQVESARSTSPTTRRPVRPDPRDQARGVALEFRRRNPDTRIVVTTDHSHTSQIVGESTDTPGFLRHCADDRRRAYVCQLRHRERHRGQGHTSGRIGVVIGRRPSTYSAGGRTRPPVCADRSQLSAGRLKFRRTRPSRATRRPHTATHKDRSMRVPAERSHEQRHRQKSEGQPNSDTATQPCQPAVTHCRAPDDHGEHQLVNRGDRVGRANP